jgi:hypothetical protein
MCRPRIIPLLLLVLVLFVPALLAGEVVPFTRQLEIMPPQASPFDLSESYVSATAVDLGAAGFAVGWGLDINPVDPESVKGVTEGRQVLPGGRLDGTFEASTDVFVPGRAMDISLASIDKTGRFVAVWSQLNDFFSGDVWFRRFANGHQPLDPEAVPITGMVDGRDDCNPAVAANGDGRFVVVWKRGPSDQGGDLGRETTSRILARVFGSEGRPLTPEIAVTEPVPTSTVCYSAGPFPSVGMDAAGSFVVSLSDGWGRRFDPEGQPLGERFRIGGAGPVSLAMLPAGDFIASWQAPVQPGIVLLSRFTPEGARTGPLVRVAVGAAPALAADSSGRVALFWIDGRRPALQVSALRSRD